MNNRIVGEDIILPLLSIMIFEGSPRGELAV
jgi:hypothetical protein